MKRSAWWSVAAVVLSCAGLAAFRSRGAPAVVVEAPPTPPTATVEPETPKAPQTPAAGDETRARPKMDLVFALDTTGSMSGLISGAKAKIWEIARRAQEGKPAPELRVGLVAYRDVGDAYVTRVVALTSDLDRVYANLSDFQAEGGGDTPEHVLKGLDDAVRAMPWSDAPNAVKLVYLVGDAPPHFDYQDGITLDSVLRTATQKGIRISAIRCGNDASTLEAFTRIAKPTDGEVATIEQSGGVITAAPTPYDTKLAKLNADLAATEVRYGSDAERAEAATVVEKNLAAPAAAQAERAGYYGARAAGGVHGATKKDLVDAPPEALAAVRDEDLPEAMRKMTPAERARFVEEQRQKRVAILAEVRAAKAERDAFVARSAATASPAEAPPAAAFDGKVFDAMKKAAAGKIGY